MVLIVAYEDGHGLESEIRFSFELSIACPCQENEQLSSNIIFEAVKLWFYVVYSDTIHAVGSCKGVIIVHVLLPAGACMFLPVSSMSFVFLFVFI